MRSTGVPSGMSRTTWNSDLLSKGSIFSTTHWTTRQPHRQQDGDEEPDVQPVAHLPAPPRPCRKGRMTRSNQRCSGRGLRRGRAGLPSRAADASSLPDSQGVNTSATASEITMPMLALIGIGLM